MGRGAAAFSAVTPGLVPGVHAFFRCGEVKTWMAGTSPAMTKKRFASVPLQNKED